MQQFRAHTPQARGTALIVFYSEFFSCRLLLSSHVTCLFSFSQLEHRVTTAGFSFPSSLLLLRYVLHFHREKTLFLILFSLVDSHRITTTINGHKGFELQNQVCHVLHIQLSNVTSNRQQQRKTNHSQFVVRIN